MGKSTQHVPLNLKQFINTYLSQQQHFVHLFAGKRFAFGGALNFDEFAGAGADDVHIDFGGGIFGIGKIDDRGVFDDPDANRGDFA